jgi:hypothetical protein
MPAMTSDSPWLAMVALRHARPGLPDHVDWLLAREEPATGRLRSFRCRVCPTLAATAAGPIGLRAMADHRPVYLDHEGPVSGDRGRVDRIARGRYRLLAGDPEGACTLEMRWESGGTHPGVVVRVRITAEPPPERASIAAEPPPAEHPGEPVRWLHSEGSEDAPA